MSRRLALLIGCSHYDDEGLDNLEAPDADVKGFGTLLLNSEIGAFDDVDILEDPTGDIARRAISKFYRERKPSDLLLVFFAGHGVLDPNGRLYLAVKDTERQLLSATGIKTTDILDDMDDSRSKRKVLILDCCHSGAFDRGRRSATNVRAITATTFEGNGNGRIVITASDSTSYAFDGDEITGESENSLFTHFLLEGLKTGKADNNRDGKITVSELYDYVYERVIPKQTPQMWSYKVEGNLIIAHNPKTIDRLPDRLPDELQQAVESPTEYVRKAVIPLLEAQLYGQDESQKRAAEYAISKLYNDEVNGPVYECVRPVIRRYMRYMDESRDQYLDAMIDQSGKRIELYTMILKESVKLAHSASGQDDAKLDQIRYSLEEVRRHAIYLDLDDTATDTLWPLYICYTHLKQYRKSINILQSIRRWVNEQRALIQDPLKRMRISIQYPHLYYELAEQLFNARDTGELLSVIEEAKGRTLTDTLAIRAQQDGLLIPPASASRWLPRLMMKLNSHYITFLTYEHVTYAVHVTRDGKVRDARLSIGTRDIDELRDALDPSRWGKRYSPFDKFPDNVAQQLNLFMDWLAEAVDDGSLREGDHICYSPDALLYLVPLHYLDFRGQPLVKLVSISRTHSASLLYHFAQRDSSRPTHFVAVKVPLAQEVDENPAKVVQLERVSNWLENDTLPGMRLDDEEADLHLLAMQKLKDALIHFAAHGYFPMPTDSTDPFRGSGIILSQNGRLPANEKGGGLLSPQRIIEPDSPFAFDGSHVTLQACVSGLAEEGIGGDALGPEWSLLMAGASSVLSTHWHIELESSATFCIHFYEEWLVNGLSRGQAWRKAVLRQMDEYQRGENDPAYHWAAFSLAGDWR